MKRYVCRYNALMSKIIFIVLAMGFFNTSFSQDIYRTQSGNILVTVVSSDSIVTLKSKEVSIFINYSTARFRLSLDKSTLESENVDINKKLSKMRSDNIELSGKLNIENINKYNQTRLDFDFGGMLLNNRKILSGNGSLDHYSSEGRLSCLLTLKLFVDKDDLGLCFEEMEFKDEVQIDVVQVLLNY